jgi:uncharacterized phage-associated protein
MNAILERSFKEGRTDMSPMKAQKILFYINGWHQAVHGEPAIDLPFEVWQYGPVVPDIYHKLKSNGSENIRHYIKEYDPQSGGSKSYVVSKNCKELYEILDIVWEKYIGIDATSLSAMTHEINSPWDRAKKEELSIIPDQYIQEYFVDLANA